MIEIKIEKENMIKQNKYHKKEEKVVGCIKEEEVPNHLAIKKIREMINKKIFKESPRKILWGFISLKEELLVIIMKKIIIITIIIKMKAIMKMEETKIKIIKKLMGKLELSK